MRRILLALLCSCFALSVYSQKLKSLKVTEPVICYAVAEDHLYYIPPPKEYLARKANNKAEAAGTVIEVTYIGFESVPQAQQAFQAAVDIWESLLKTTVPIRIEARWTPLGEGVLGSANYTNVYANFRGAPKLEVFYPVAIAEKITGRELNSGAADIFANFNSAFDWHFDPTTIPPVGKYDLTSVVLHEIGHGLGFSSSMFVSGTTGSYGLGSEDLPITYDVGIEDGGNANLIETISNNSGPLGTALTSANLFFDGPSGRRKIYAPTVYDGGSSVSHLDEGTWNGTVNGLMTPQIAPRERLHAPGVAMGILNDIGWEIVKINHIPLPESDNLAGPYPVVVDIKADNGYDDESVKLHYTTDGSTFTEVTMTPTGTENTFTANIPGDGTSRTYGYYISVKNTVGGEYVNPGKLVRPLNTHLQNFFTFKTGPDTEAPKITHTKRSFMVESETALTIDARITDNSGSVSAIVAYSINDGPQSEAVLNLNAPQEDSLYSVTLNFGALTVGDQIKYRIHATDNSNSHIEAFSPAENYHILNVVQVEATRISYENDFENEINDVHFIGNGYSIVLSENFTDRAIHSEHPYLNGEGFPGNERNLIYQLRIPILLKSSEATIKFDEVALIEPGASGSVFGDSDFYDYVIVEGSNDGGVTWEPLLSGYDSREQNTWLTRYNSNIDSDGNSTAEGSQSLYKSRTINMLERFEPGEEILIRFRLFIDEVSSAWGWAIDNLKIQVDDIPPLISHNHINYLTEGSEELTVISKVSDSQGIDEHWFEFFVNSGESQVQQYDVSELISEYEFSLTGLSVLTDGDTLYYRLGAKDGSGNIGHIPTTGFLKVPIVEFGESIANYVNDFNEVSHDFIGNFFIISTPTRFNDGAIHSEHPYMAGQGLDLTSDFSYTLRKPIKISASNSTLQFDEIVLVEGHDDGVVFGTPQFNDYVVVEGSKDGGLTWTSFADGYDIVGNSKWVFSYTNSTPVVPSLYATRTIDMTESGDFEAGDDVLIRFRMLSNQSVTGWGWTIDNLAIQSVITDTESTLESGLSVYPNPTTEKISVEINNTSGSQFSIQLLTLQGQKLYDATELPVNGKMAHTIAAGHLASGMYLVKISNGSKSAIRKVIKTN